MCRTFTCLVTFSDPYFVYSISQASAESLRATRSTASATVATYNSVCLLLGSITHVLHGNSGFPEIRNSSTLFTRIRNLGEALQIFRIPVNSVREFRICGDPKSRIYVAVLHGLSDKGTGNENISIKAIYCGRYAAARWPPWPNCRC